MDDATNLGGHVFGCRRLALSKFGTEIDPPFYIHLLNSSVLTNVLTRHTLPPHPLVSQKVFCRPNPAARFDARMARPPEIGVLMPLR